jgi:hypothetical protein
MTATILEEMLGKTIVEIKGTKHDKQMLFITENECFKFWHEQQCCESVTVEDITGDLSDLIGEPLLMAESVSKHEIVETEWEDRSRKWTFYKFATRKGYVDIRWVGESNGYYSEEVDYINFPVDLSLKLETTHFEQSYTWGDAKMVAFSANIDGKNDWRLPTALEWNTLSLTNENLKSAWLDQPYQWMYDQEHSVECNKHDTKWTSKVILVRDLD